MLLINPREKFHRNKEFELIKENKKNILKNKSTGGRVEIDGIGRRILEYLPSNLNTIKKKLETEHDMIISYTLLYFYLLVFWKGHLIEKTNKKIKFDSKKTGSDEKKTNISIVIVTYNGEKFINENLNSIQNQTFLPGEIIIVDNASSDNTINILKKYATRVKLIRNKKNLHYAKGVNIGVQNATGDIIVILNQDVVLDDHFLAEVEKKYQSSANKHDLAAIVPQMRFMKLKGFINSMGNRISNRGWGSDNYFGVVDIGQLKALKFEKSTCFGAIAVTHNGWKEVGKLDEKYGSYYEDVDWSFRAHLKAKKMIVAPDAIVYHHFGGSYDPGLRLKFVIKNRLRFILKNFSGRVMFGFLK
ncbi:MAG: glycosyltransferase family 2 protein, partial [Candidatus Aminicenantes bacterium]|nr:glycosyltransferase family 2 protein [Candidatus Aminicenantes bacterium]